MDGGPGQVAGHLGELAPTGMFRDDIEGEHCVSSASYCLGVPSGEFPVSAGLALQGVCFPALQNGEHFPGRVEGGEIDVRLECAGVRVESGEDWLAAVGAGGGLDAPACGSSSHLPKGGEGQHVGAPQGCLDDVEKNVEMWRNFSTSRDPRPLSLTREMTHLV